jgi:transposase InsO family protein
VGLSEFMELLDACLRYHNKTRPKERLGWTSPMQYRRSLGLAA